MEQRKYIPKGDACAPPIDVKYALSVLKEGSIVDEVDLTAMGRDHYLFGRNKDVCDISLDHPSISRQQ